MVSTPRFYGRVGGSLSLLKRWQPWHWPTSYIFDFVLCQQQLCDTSFQKTKSTGIRTAFNQIFKTRGLHFLSISKSHIFHLIFVLYPTPRIALSVRPSVTEKHRIVYSQCMYDAIIIMMTISIFCVRCDHHDDDDHHHLCTMQSS